MLGEAAEEGERVINEFERQKQIRHLGLISNVFENGSHTRYEYLMLQAV